MDKRRGCGAVLASKGASLVGIKWSEYGFLYFAFILLVSTVPIGSFEQRKAIVAIAATLVSPYIIYSLGYQYAVAKEWCRLCILVQLLLCLQFFWALYYYWPAYYLPMLTPALLFSLVAFISIPAAIWLLIKPLLSGWKAGLLYRNGYYRLLHDPDNFATLLAKQPNAIAGWDKLGILIGNPQAANTLLKICNPYCGPCSKAHQLITKILSTHSHINLRIIFTATVEADDMRNKPVARFLQLAQEKDSTMVAQALHYWYTSVQKDHAVFAQLFPVQGDEAAQMTHIAAMRHWCEENETRATPTFFYNGKKMPAGYGLQELVQLL